MEKYHCLACEQKLDFQPWNGDLCSYEICPHCGIQFGYDDAAGGDKEKRQKIYTNWKVAWLANGKQKLSKEQERAVVKASLES